MNRKERRATATRNKAVLPTSFGPEASRLFGSGVQYHQAGLLDEAISHYQSAIDRKSNFLAARQNLGLALMARGKLQEAVAQFRKAIALKPNFIELYNNLGRALFSLGRIDEAMATLRRALARGGSPETKILFVVCARLLDVPSDFDDFFDLMGQALSEPWSRPGEVGAITGHLLQQDKSIKPHIERAARAWPPRLAAEELQKPPGLSAICGHHLLRCLLLSTPVCGVELERFLTALRFAILSAASATASSAAADQNTVSFCCALAQQCFLNEYVFAATADELERVRDLRDRLADAIEAGDAISELRLAAVATYFPLHALSDAASLLDRTWSPPVTELLKQQVREPEQERQLRATIPAITAIDDDVSVAVREQYEENPYPRWVKAEPSIESPTLDHYLRARLPQAKFNGLGSDREIDILIAGCGTGRHAIKVAQQLTHARVLAIDLSLASLSYAKRKTVDLGLNGIEYAQADILELRSIGRRFDVIEANGVLHHLASPFEGWRVLLVLLRPGGAMRIGLYSELARRDITAARRFIAERGYAPTASDIRRCRQEITNLDAASAQRKVAAAADFFTMSECRDLLFHVQEHCHRLPEIAAFINDNDLQVLGFELSVDSLRRYQARFPSDQAATNLDFWHIFERANPDSFLGMYQFWVQKRAP
jgi:2-polyprenyl-3-methyl-5-hydroxy-6-metoxy-1,4-benzoquinol methylase